MVFKETSIAGAYLVGLKRLEDDRGFFARAWSSKEFEEMGLATVFPDTNFSYSYRKGTIRGFHYQHAPHAEAKFIRCVRGALFEVMIDLRPDSPTFLKWEGHEIRASDYQAIYVPAGCARGVQTLEDDSEMLYMASACFHPGAEAGIRWDDPFFGVKWRDVGQIFVSEKDQSWPDYQQPLVSAPTQVHSSNG